MGMEIFRSIPISKPAKEESDKDRMENIKKYIEERESARNMQIEKAKTVKINKIVQSRARISIFIKVAKE